MFNLKDTFISIEELKELVAEIIWLPLQLKDIKSELIVLNIKRAQMYYPYYFIKNYRFFEFIIQDIQCVFINSYDIHHLFHRVNIISLRSLKYSVIYVIVD